MRSGDLDILVYCEHGRIYSINNIFDYVLLLPLLALIAVVVVVAAAAAAIATAVSQVFVKY